jgi:hypothetical protein
VGKRLPPRGEKITPTDVVVGGDEHGLVAVDVAVGGGEDGAGRIVRVDVRPAVGAGQAAVHEVAPVGHWVHKI